MKPKQGYLPTLDGWRAIAILLVILYHDYLYRFGSFSDRWFNEHGLHGVDIFFAISGLLICSRLLEEEVSTGSISLKGFYIRRALRILPAAYFYLLTIISLRLNSIIPLTPKELLASALFYRNYSRFSDTPGHINWYTGHFWSLAVEEHFYLILPGVLYFIPKRWRVVSLGALTVMVCMWRLYRQQTRPWEFLMQHTDTRLDALLFPAILAILLSRPHLRSLFTRFAKYWWIPAFLFLGLLTTKFERLTPLAETVLIPLTLSGTLLLPSGYFARFLESTPLRWLGRISYSLYLWQQLFFDGHFLGYYQPLGFLQTFPFRWLALFIVATASYYLIEKPFIRLGHALAPPATPGRHEDQLGLRQRAWHGRPADS